MTDIIAADIGGTNARFARASLDDYTLLFLPYAPYMSEAFAQRIKKWTEKGGTLVAIGPFAEKDEFGFDLPSESSLFKTIFPDATRTGARHWDYALDGKKEISPPGVRRAAFGKGALVHLNCPLDSILRNTSLRAELEEALRKADTRTALSPHPMLKTMVRDGADGKRYLGICNLDVANAVETAVAVRGKYLHALDLLVPGWFPVPASIQGDKTVLKVRLAPGDWTMILLQDTR